VQIREFDKSMKLSAFQDLLLTMAEQNPETEAFKNCKEFEKIIFIDAENIIENVKDMIKNANGLIAKIT
jgi:hypothetical protein